MMLNTLLNGQFSFIYLLGENETYPLNLLVGLGEEFGVTPESWEWKSYDRMRVRKKNITKQKN